MPEPRHAPNRPHRTRADERSEEIDIRPTKLLADIEQLNGQLAEAQTQADEYLTALQRERAEFLNFKRRTAEERERDLGLAGEDLIRKVLAVADDFDRAIDARPESIAEDAWFEGVAAIDRKLRALLESEGVSTISAELMARALVERPGVLSLLKSAASPITSTVVRQTKRRWPKAPATVHDSTLPAT